MSAPRSQDLFELTTRGKGEALQHVWRIKCSKCPATFDVVNGARSRLPTAMLAKRFAGAGFRVSIRNGGHHLCAECAAKPAKPPRPEHLRLVAPPEPQPSEDLTMPPTAEPARQPTREQRQTIHAAIDRNWSITGGGYAGNLSDEKLAEQLNVPRAWVAEVRDMLFGADTNEAREAGLAELDAFEARAAEIEGRAMQLAADAETLKADIARFRKAVAS